MTTYLVIQRDNEGEISPDRMDSFSSLEMAQEYIRKRVAQENLYNLHRFKGAINNPEGIHQYNPDYLNTFEVLELEEAALIETPIIPVWLVKITLDRLNNDETYILRFFKQEDHLTYFPASVEDIPVSLFKARLGYQNWAFVFSKENLNHAFTQAEEYLRSLSKPIKYINSNKQ